MEEYKVKIENNDEPDKAFDKKMSFAVITI